MKIIINKVDPDSKLAPDLASYASRNPGKEPCVSLSVSFSQSYPFDPLFVRVIKIVIKNGYVLAGGAPCLELLTKDGWRPSMSVEKVIISVIASMCSGGAQVAFDQNAELTYSLQKAQASYKNMVAIHAKSGWYTPAKHKG